LKDWAIRLSSKGKVVSFPFVSNSKGFLLISVIFIMMLMAVSIFSINYYSVTQIRMTSNHAVSIQTRYDLNAIVEESVWKLTDNPFWRTIEAGEDTVFDGTTYTRIVRNADTAPFNYPSSFDDAVTIQVTPKGSSQSFQKSFRYYAFELSGISSELEHPERIAMTPSGNLLVADKLNHKVIQVDPDTSAITIIAGTGTSGEGGDGSYSGSNRPGLDSPHAAIYDPSDTSYYIADTKNNRILWGNYSGSSWWFEEYVGTGDKGYSGDDGPSNNARLDEPQDVLRDTSNGLYIADTKNDCIRKVNVDTDVITTVAGIGGSSGSTGDGGLATSATLREPKGICLDSIGNLYIADTKNHKIRKVDISTSIISTVAGTGSSGSSGDGGAATNARLNEPKDIFVDKSGNIFIADEKNQKIRVVNATDGKIYTLTGTGALGDLTDLPAVEATLKKPSGITMASSYGGGKIIISDKDNNKIKFLLLKPVYGL